MNWSKNIGSLLSLFFIGLFYLQTTQEIVEEKRFFDSNWTNLRDDAGIYYAYLPATFLKNDPLFTFLDHESSTVPEKGIQYWAFKSDHGGWVPKMTMGKAILDLPFFLLADAYVESTQKYERNGFSLPYRFSIVAATLFYAFLGLVVMRSVLLKFFSDRTTALTLIIIALGTNFFHYSTHETGYTHPHNFFIMVSLIWLAIHWDRKKYVARSIFFGILCGLLILVRPVNIFLLIPLPFFYSFFKNNTFSGSNLLRGLQTFLLSRRMFLAVFAALLVVLPQLIFWKVQSGSWIYYSYNDEGFFFMQPSIFEGLFSFRKGWFVYTPVMFFAVLGCFWLFKTNPWLGISISLTWVVFVYVTFSWWCWWYGGGFGARTMIDIYPLLALSLAGLLQAIVRSHWLHKTSAAIAILAAVYLNTFQTSQYHLSLIHWDSMTYDAYKSVFLSKTFPDNYSKLLSEPNYQKQKETGDE